MDDNNFEDRGRRAWERRRLLASIGDGGEGGGPFAPLAHTHTASAITDFDEAVDDRVGTLITAGTGISVSYNDGTNTLTITNTSLAGDASAITYTPTTLADWGGIDPGNVDGALDYLAANAGGGGGGAVSDFNGRTGSITPLQADYDGFFLTPAEGNAAYQPLDADLTSWAGVTRAAGFDTFVATPSSANLAALVTGETGSGALVFGTSPTLTQGAAISGAAGTNRLLSFQTAGVNRFVAGVTGTAEVGADAGSPFGVFTYTDAGVLIDAPITITRAAGGTMTFDRPTDFSSNAVSGITTLTTTNLTMGGAFSLADTGAVSFNIASSANTDIPITLSDASSSWTFGLDNSDSNAFVLSSGTGLGTNNVLRASTTSVQLGTGVVLDANSNKLTNLAAGTNAGDAVRFDQLQPAGSVVQVVNTQTGALTTGAAVIIPLDDTIPQNTEGVEYMTCTITPKSATNKLRIDVTAHGASSTVGPFYITAALFQDSTAGALAAQSGTINTAVHGRPVNFTHYMTAGTTSATTFKIRMGPNAAGTFTFNGIGGGRLFGGVMASSITITEIVA